MEHLDFLDLFSLIRMEYVFTLNSEIEPPPPSAPLGDANLNLDLSSLLDFYLFSFQVVSFFYPTGRVLEVLADEASPLKKPHTHRVEVTSRRPPAPPQSCFKHYIIQFIAPP